MGLGGTAAHLTEVTDRSEVVEALNWAQAHNLPICMIGEGSNSIWGDAGFPGLVIVNRILQYSVSVQDETNAYITIGSGEPWDSVVARTVEAGFTGIEALSLVPGTAGATPIQNVGAYGQEISQTLMTVEAFDNNVGDYVTIPAAACGFGYRTSRFKTTDKGQFFITAITLHLRRDNPLPPFYGSVQDYFDAANITEYTPANLREAVIAIRTAKLPDPAIVNNTGSFFGNPVVSEAQYLALAEQYPDVPHWPTASSDIKLSAAWLIEQSGFKDYHDEETGMATWPKQPLVLVNEHAESTADLLKFKQKIVDTVQAKFGIMLEQEPEMLS